MTEQKRIVLPGALRKIIAAGRWRQPSDDAMRRLVQFDDLPFDFHLSIEALTVGGFDHLLRDRAVATEWHLYRSGWLRRDKPLPWIDVRKVIAIADGRVAGSDSMIVLDLRGSAENPPVLANDWTSGQSGCVWRMISPSLTEFVDRIEALEFELRAKTTLGA